MFDENMFMRLNEAWKYQQNVTIYEQKCMIVMKHNDKERDVCQQHSCLFSQGSSPQSENNRRKTEREKAFNVATSLTSSSWKRGGENKGGRGARRRRPGGCGHLNGSGRIYTPSAKQRVKRSHFCPCWMLGEGEQTTLHSSVLRSLFSSQPFWSTQQTFRTGLQSNGALTDLLHMLRGSNCLPMFSKTQSSPQKHQRGIIH